MIFPNRFHRFLVLTGLLLLLFLAGCTRLADRRNDGGDMAPPVPPLPKAFTAGFQVLPFSYEYNGQTRSSMMAVWYPSKSPAALHAYGDGKPSGHVALNGAFADGSFPVILFSHGYGGCGVQSVFLTQSLAENGYLVLAPDYPEDAKCSSGPGGERLPTEFSFTAFRNPSEWTNQDPFYYRLVESRAVLSTLRQLNDSTDGPFYRHANLNQLAMMGHSLGGYTTAAMIGGWPSWKEPSIQAAVMLSPFIEPLTLNGELEKISVPVMLQGGTLDFGITPTLSDAYGQFAGPRYFLVYKRASHMAWTNRACREDSVEACLSSDAQARDIVRYVTAFFDAYVKKTASVAPLTETSSELQSLEHMP